MELDNFNEARITHHNRFQRLCDELVGSAEQLTLLFGQWSGRIPDNFVEDFNPVYIKFGSLYEEFGECMSDLGKNEVSFADFIRKYHDSLETQIAKYKAICEINDALNETSTEIIKAQTELIAELRKELGE